MRLVNADAYSAEMKDRQEAAWKWRNEAIAEEDELKLARAEGAFTAFTEAKLTMDKHIINPWHRVEEPPNFSGKVLVWRDVIGDFGDHEYTFDTAYYNGLDGGQIPKGTFFQPIPEKMEYRVLDDVTHWARPEPPNEGNNGSSRKEASSDL